MYDPQEVTGTEELANEMAFAASFAIGDYCLREGVAMTSQRLRAIENSIARIVFQQLEDIEASYD